MTIAISGTSSEMGIPQYERIVASRDLTEISRDSVVRRHDII